MIGSAICADGLAQKEERSSYLSEKDTTSYYGLTNPPNNSCIWQFEASQLIWVRISNFNILGVTVGLDCENYVPGSGNYSRGWILPPRAQTFDQRYDIFAYVPVLSLIHI